MSSEPRVRMATLSDLEAVAGFFAALWPESAPEEHRAEAASVLSGAPISTMPLVVFVAEVEGKPIAFIEVGLRSHADGCDTSRPVGFLEGWYVEPAHRRRGVGGALVRAAEDWARSKECREMGSDTWVDHEDSQRAHEGLGFEVVDRCVHYRKGLD
jgi:aminoglycoside 6'-N-acetyltransferase I